MRISVRKRVLSLGLGASVVAVSACDPGSVSTGGSVYYGASYYDSMLWNDYYYGGHTKPDRPDRPTRPPITNPDPGFSRPPVHRPPAARPPIHRPAGGGRLR